MTKERCTKVYKNKEGIIITKWEYCDTKESTQHGENIACDCCGKKFDKVGMVLYIPDPHLMPVLWYCSMSCYRIHKLIE